MDSTRTSPFWGATLCFELPGFKGAHQWSFWRQQLQMSQPCYHQTGQVQAKASPQYLSLAIWCDLTYKAFKWQNTRVFAEDREDRQTALPLTSTISAAGLPTSPRRGMLLAAEPRGPHLGCFCVSGTLLFFGLCSSGKSNLLNSNSGLEVDVLFSRTLDFRSVRLWQPSVTRGWKAGIKVTIQLAH